MHEKLEHIAPVSPPRFATVARIVREMTMAAAPLLASGCAHQSDTPSNQQLTSITSEEDNFGKKITWKEAVANEDHAIAKKDHGEAAAGDGDDEEEDSTVASENPKGDGKAPVKTEQGGRTEATNGKEAAQRKAETPNDNGAEQKDVVYNLHIPSLRRSIMEERLQLMYLQASLSVSEGALEHSDKIPTFSPADFASINEFILDNSNAISLHLVIPVDTHNKFEEDKPTVTLSPDRKTITVDLCIHCKGSWPWPEDDHDMQFTFALTKNGIQDAQVRGKGMEVTPQKQKDLLESLNRMFDF